MDGWMVDGWVIWSTGAFTFYSLVFIFPYQDARDPLYYTMSLGEGWRERETWSGL